ncbi:MAG: NAD-dependent epimerase/dehydratase family protein [Magnetospiraceae bacterium]
MALYLVTGGCGFIGSHLADALLARGDRVRILDDLSSGKRANAPQGADLIIGDIADTETMCAAMHGVDGCFHLAAVASVQKSLHDWVGTHRTNMYGTVSVFDAARQAGPVPVVYASSAAIYGDNQSLPLAESEPPAPLSSYGADKYGNEVQGNIAWSVHGVPTTGLRFFNVYGPRQDPSSPYSGVISIFMNRIPNGQPIFVYGDGEQTRDFIYVGDVARHLMAAMETGSTGARVFNLCTGRATSINRLAEIIAELSDRPLQVDQKPARDGDIRHSLGQGDRARRAFGMVPETRLVDGLRLTLDAETGINA